MICIYMFFRITMTATDQMRAMLDAMMGTSRNGEYFTCPQTCLVILMHLNGRKV